MAKQVPAKAGAIVVSVPSLVLPSKPSEKKAQAMLKLKRLKDKTKVENSDKETTTANASES